MMNTPSFDSPVECFKEGNLLVVGRKGGVCVGTIVSHLVPVNDVLQRQMTEPAIGTQIPSFMHGFVAQMVLLSCIENKHDGKIIL